MLETTITKENINIFVIKFYENIIEDEQLAPFFTKLLGDDIKNEQWQKHIEILTDFWSSMILKDDNYSGSPFPPHATMEGLQRETFEQWLKILDKTLKEVYDEDCSMAFKKTGKIIATNFMRILGL